MNNQIKVGHFTGDGGIVNLPLGFIPDFFRLTDFTTDTNIIFYEWYREMEQFQASGKQEGISIAEGVTANMADDAGIIAYDTGTQGPTVTTWTQAVGSAATVGTYVKPSVASDSDRGSIYECITDGTSAATEPVWPDADGEQVLDGTTLWEKVNVSLSRGGYQGVVIQDDIQTNSIEYYYTALMADQSINHGDVDGWTDGTDPNA